MKRLLAIVCGIVSITILLTGCGTSHTSITRVGPTSFTVCEYDTGFLNEAACHGLDPAHLDKTCKTIGLNIAKVEELHGGENLVTCR